MRFCKRFVTTLFFLGPAGIHGNGILQLGPSPTLRERQLQSNLRKGRDLQIQSCTDTSPSFGGGGISTGQCITGWTRGNTYNYPADFEGVTNQVTIYECPVSDRRIIVSNGIPDHSVGTSANNPCEVNWYVSLPLSPSLTSTKLEPPPAGIIAMALNGVPTFGALEATNGNAVEPEPDGIQGARFWYGHATGGNVWHFHNPQMGKEQTPASETLLGYALDGFPIYGPVADASTLDECNGILNPGTGEYQYHVMTPDQVDETLGYCNGSEEPNVNWRYIIGCYYGDVLSTVVGDSTDPVNTIPNDCVSTSVPTASPTRDTDYKKPNIIVMQPDDFEFFDEWTPPPNNPSENSAEVHEFPNGYGMPHLERLRTQGVQMMQAYTASSKCGTSRYSTLTGRYPSRSAGNRNTATDDVAYVTIPRTKLVDEGDEKDCTEGNMAALLQANGYRTGVVGKWHLHRIDSTQYNYADAVDDIKNCGFDFADGIYVENLDTDFADGSFTHNMEWVTSEAIDFMNDKETYGDKPFFLYFNPTVPHSSGNVKDALNDFSCRDTANGTLSSDPSIKGMTAEYGDDCVAYRNSIFSRAGGLESNSDLGSIWIDDSVGALFQALEDLGELDNTIFLFQLDHGMDAKNSLWESGSRIPQFIHYPYAFGTQGSQFNGLVSTIDVAATLAEFAEVTSASTGYYRMDGRSWKGAIGNADEESKWKNDRCLLFELDYDRAVRCGCNKLLEINDVNDSSTYTAGERRGYPSETKMHFDLCTSDGDFTHFPAENPETISILGSDVEQDSELEDVLNCFKDKTSPLEARDFNTALCSTDTVPATDPTAQPTTSPTACSDSTGRFPIENGLTRTCNWVALNLGRCSNYGSYCRVTCDLCPSPTDPTAEPTVSPTPGPSVSPTPGPSVSPTPGPTVSPTPGPTVSPTPGPTVSPTSGPTVSPTSGPTVSPTSGPTVSPTSGPTVSPTPGPTNVPTVLVCQDQTGRFPISATATRRCPWVANRPIIRCVNYGNFCPLTCGLCTV